MISFEQILRMDSVTALESYLKVQELSDGCVVAKAESVLGIRHGPMTVINDKTLVCVFLSRDSYVHSYEIDLLRELRAKRLGLKTVVCAPHVSIASGPSVALQELADVVIALDHSATESVVSAPPANHLWVAPAVLVGQIVGLMKSVALGLKPDAPSEADVISRVVQGVMIYPYPHVSGQSGDM